MSGLYQRFRAELRKRLVAESLLGRHDPKNPALASEARLFMIWQHSIRNLMPEHEIREFDSLTDDEKKQYFVGGSQLSFDQFLLDFRDAALRHTKFGASN
jgi:hypothetical protein